MDPVERSKLIAKILRHDPKLGGLTLDDEGWAHVDALLDGLAKLGLPMSPAQLLDLVEVRGKRRFVVSEDGSKIRASHGHTVAVELGYVPATPPSQLFHGTVARNLGAIAERGLLPMRRQHVHLAPDVETARRVAMRYGTPVILVVDAARMHTDGFAFFLSDHGVWLTPSVPYQYCLTDGPIGD